jgi:nucleoside phosphorylase
MVQTGMGGQRLTEALKRAHEEEPVSRVIHFGFAGGLDPDVTPGQLLRPIMVMDTKGGVMALDQPRPRSLKNGEPPPAGPRLISINHVIHDVKEKQALYQAHRCQMIDMESFAAAQACEAMGLAYTSVRAVSDAHDTALPAQAEKWIDERGQLHMGRVTRFLLTHPGWVPSLAKLGQYADKAGKALADVVLAELAKVVTS